MVLLRKAAHMNSEGPSVETVLLRVYSAPAGFDEFSAMSNDVTT